MDPHAHTQPPLALTATCPGCHKPLPAGQVMCSACARK